MLALQTPEDMFFMLYGHGRDMILSCFMLSSASTLLAIVKLATIDAGSMHWLPLHGQCDWWDQQFKKHCFLSQQWFLAIVSNWKPAAIHIDRNAWKHIWRQANSQFPTWPLIRCTQPAFALHVHPMLSPRMKRTPWSLLVFPGGPIIRVLLK